MDLHIRAVWPGRRIPSQGSLQVVRENPDTQDGAGRGQAPQSFEGRLVRDAGARFAGAKTFIDIYAGLTDNQFRRYRQQHPEEGRIVTGVFQRAHDAGIEQGRAEGERAVLERLLRRRFGRLPPEAAERLRRAAEAELETWADNVLDAGTLDEVFRRTT